MNAKIRSSADKIEVITPVYGWEWERHNDIFSLYDSRKRLIGRGRHQPLLITNQCKKGNLYSERSINVHEDRILITYFDNDSQLTAKWVFQDDHALLKPLRYETSKSEDIIRLVYFAEHWEDSYKPSFYSRYAVVPGLSMSPNISPVVDLHSRLNVTAVLGSGAMRGPGLTQQWGLPAHYFCTFNTSDRWNALGARNLQSGAACWGLAGLPAGDFRLELREIGLSPVLNLRGDLWQHLQTPGLLELGPSFMIAFGAQFHEAIRNYYRILVRENMVMPKPDSISARKRAVLLAPQYNTWGVESAKALPPEELDEPLLLDTFHKLHRSGMKTRTFVVDDKWERAYGELRHDPVRFPNFESLLNEIRSAGYFIGLWAAFLRCQDPNGLGLDESNLLQSRDGRPLWLSHGASRYGIFDITQPDVQNVLRQRARQFIRSYRPDLIKFDFGYELPSLDVAAPADKNWAGERLLRKGLDVIVGAMREENPDLVIMYYGLSPLLIDSYDLHSPDDLVYCGGDYDLETNRRIFFSCLCGELGMPTYGSSGYDWQSARDIWFDSAPSGTLGSLHCFDGDENGDLPYNARIAKYNGLAAILRTTTMFQIHPIDAEWQGGFRAAFSPSWERVEQGRTVLLAMRTHRFDGKPARQSYKSILHTDMMIVVASLAEEDISHASRVGIVPFGKGRCRLQTVHIGKARIIHHFFGGRSVETELNIENGQIELVFHASNEQEFLEWVEILLPVSRTEAGSGDA